MESVPSGVALPGGDFFCSGTLILSWATDTVASNADSNIGSAVLTRSFLMRSFSLATPEGMIGLIYARLRRKSKPSAPHAKIAADAGSGTGRGVPIVPVESQSDE